MHPLLALAAAAQAPAPAVTLPEQPALTERTAARDAEFFQTLIYGEWDDLANKDDILRWLDHLDPAESLAVAAGGDFLVAREKEIVAVVGAAANEVRRRPAG